MSNVFELFSKHIKPEIMVNKDFVFMYLFFLIFQYCKYIQKKGLWHIKDRIREQTCKIHKLPEPPTHVREEQLPVEVCFIAFLVI